MIGRLSTLQFNQSGVSTILDAQAEVARLQEQIGTGRRIMRPSDDPSGSVQLVKLNTELSKGKIEEMIRTIIKETSESEFCKIGKNIYITNKERGIRLTINSFTNRIITADKLSKKQFTEGKQSFVFDNHFRPQIHFITQAWNLYWFEEMDTKFWPDMKNKYGIESPGQQNNTLDKSFERPTKHVNPSKEFKDLFTEIYYEDCKAFGYDLPF